MSVDEENYDKIWCSKNQICWKSGLKFPSIIHERSWILPPLEGGQMVRTSKWGMTTWRDAKRPPFYTMKKWMPWILDHHKWSWLDELHYITNLPIPPPNHEKHHPNKESSQFFSQHLWTRTRNPKTLTPSGISGTCFNNSSYLSGLISGAGMVLTFRLGRGVVGEVVSGPQQATKVPSQIPKK